MPRPNNGPKLSPKPNAHGFYEIRWSDNGRSRRLSTGARDVQSASKVFANFILLDERQRDVLTRGDRPLMVADAFGDPEIPGKDYWHEHVEKNVVDKISVRFARAKIIQHFGHLAIKDITPDDVDAYIEARWQGRIGRPSVNHTISKELSFLNAAINHAVRQQRLAKTDQPFIKLPGTSEARDRWLIEEEADALIAAAREVQIRQANKKHLPRIYLFVMLALNTASRKGALIEMKWEQVDFNAGIIKLNPKGRQQTKKRRPTVPISDELMPILKRAYEEQGKPKPEAHVLGHPGSIRTAFDNAVARAGLGADVTPHVLRHTWATWAAMAGEDMYKIATVLGDNVQTVIKNYAHCHPAFVRDTVNNVRPSKRKKPDLRIVA